MSRHPPSHHVGENRIDRAGNPAFAVRSRVVDGDDGVVNEAEQRVAVVLVVANRRLQRLGWEERRLDGIAALGRTAPASAVVDTFADEVRADIRRKSKLKLVRGTGS